MLVRHERASNPRLPIHLNPINIFFLKEEEFVVWSPGDMNLKSALKCAVKVETEVEHAAVRIWGYSFVSDCRGGSDICAGV